MAEAKAEEVVRVVVQQLGMYGYRGPQDWEWGDATDAPAWPQVEAAIRRLDGGEFAGVGLHLRSRRRGEPAGDSFSVCGGPGGFCFSYRVGCRYLHYVDPEAAVPGGEVWVVRRDQGVRAPACNVCRDVEVVVEAARWFFGTAEPHPDTPWGG